MVLVVLLAGILFVLPAQAAEQDVAGDMVQVHVPAETDESPLDAGTTYYTLGGGTSAGNPPWSSGARRIQILYNGASCFGGLSGSQTISKIGFRHNSATTTTLSNVYIKLKLTLLTTLDGTFANNYEGGSPTQVFFRSSYTVGGQAGTAGGNNGYNAIALDEPFTYNPATHNLLVEITYTASTASVNCYNSSSRTNTYNIWASSATATIANSSANGCSDAAFDMGVSFYTLGNGNQGHFPYF